MIAGIDDFSSQVPSTPPETLQTYRVTDTITGEVIYGLEAIAQHIKHILLRPKGALIGYPPEYGFDRIIYKNKPRDFIEGRIVGDVTMALSFLGGVQSISLDEVIEYPENPRKLKMRFTIMTEYGRLTTVIEELGGV